MSHLHFTIQQDIRRRLLRVTATGFWVPDDVRAYACAKRAALKEMARMGCPLHETRILVNSSQQGPQSQDVVNELEAILSGTEFAVKRVAIVVSSALLARQSERSSHAHNVFYDSAEAERWLLAAD